MPGAHTQASQTSQAPLSQDELQLLRSFPSEPEVLAEASGEGVAVFRLDRGDNAGLVYWLGTRGYLRAFRSPMSFGQLNVSSYPGMASGSEDAVVSRVTRECRTAEAPGCWLCVDVGRSRALRPTHIRVTHGSPLAGRDMTSWALEGRDTATSQWTRVKALPTLRSQHASATVPVDAGSLMFSQVRLVSTGPQMDGNHALHISDLELFGCLFLVKP